VLHNAISESPVQTISYCVKKYCRIPVGELKEDKQYITLKPKQVVLVEWRYTNYITPDILSLQFENVADVESDKSFDPYWTSQRLQKWLSINTKEEISEIFS
jgi:hypothetical protein